MSLAKKKFEHPTICLDGSTRAQVHLKNLDTLWINTGTLCNISCANCYIESTPTNDRLSYISFSEFAEALEQLEQFGHKPKQLGFTGGEPFMNPDIITILDYATNNFDDVLVLTNAMRPLMRPRIKSGLLALRRQAHDKMTLRVSLDDNTADLHDHERGAGSFDITCAGIDWLVAHEFRVSIAGRLWGREEDVVRQAYGVFFAEKKWPIDPLKADQLVLFPEMTPDADPPEITEQCWDILHKSPESVMCATSRMLVKRKNADKPSLTACTLLPYDDRFDLGPDMSEADQTIALQHPWCASFCVLGGASCAPET